MIKYKKARVIEALNNYLMHEWFDIIDELPEDGIIPLAWTISGLDDDEEHDIEIKLDLNELCYLNYIDGKMVLKEPIDSIEQLIKDLNNASFDDMIYNCLKKGREIYGDNNNEK